MGGGGRRGGVNTTGRRFILYCEFGKHLWKYEREGNKGVLPVVCTEHRREFINARNRGYKIEKRRQEGKETQKRLGTKTSAEYTKDRLDYIFGITFLPGPETFDMSAFPLADAECKHGALPQDKTITCNCWKDHYTK